MEFIYAIPEPETKKRLLEITECFTAKRAPLPEEEIKFEVGKNGQVEVTGNAEGWFYLAHLCIEMGYAASHDPKYEISRRADLSPQGTAVNFRCTR